MRSVEVYQSLREVLGPFCKAAGFRRAKTSMLGWCRPVPGTERFLVFWCQCRQEGWDPSEGSAFTVELQVSAEPVVGTGRLRHRLGALLSDLDRARVGRMQNDNLAALPRGEDLWFRYRSKEDVRRWGELIRQLLPDAFQKMEHLAHVAG